MPAGAHEAATGVPEKKLPTADWEHWLGSVPSTECPVWGTAISLDCGNSAAAADSLGFA